MLHVQDVRTICDRMAESKRLGQIAEAAVLRDALERGYRVALPYGEDAPYDLIVERRSKLDRVQCKFVRSDGRVIVVRCRSTNGWRTHHYTSDEVEWIATYDATTARCYFVPAEQLGSGRSTIHLRLDESRNGQVVGVRYASDFLDW